jgi:hypothetical protein
MVLLHLLCPLNPHLPLEPNLAYHGNAIHHTKLQAPRQTPTPDANTSTALAHCFCDA